MGQQKVSTPIREHTLKTVFVLLRNFRNAFLAHFFFRFSTRYLLSYETDVSGSGVSPKISNPYFHPFTTPRAGSRRGANTHSAPKTALALLVFANQFRAGPGSLLSEL
jgi:hypothetical protein